MFIWFQVTGIDIPDSGEVTEVTLDPDNPDHLAFMNQP